MIKINLVKAGGVQSQAMAGFGPSATDSQKQGLLKLGGMLLVPLLLFGFEAYHIPDLQSDLSSKQKLLASLTLKNDAAKGAVDEIKKFKDDQSKLQKQIDTLEGLRRERLKEVKVMDNLQKDIPEKVWLTKIDFQEAKIVISGLATADTELTSFMENLSASVFLHDVNLLRSSEQPSESGVLKKFDISCAVDLQSPGASPEVKK